jgi:predicted CXXCH cytochrome family protein
MRFSSRYRRPTALAFLAALAVAIAAFASPSAPDPERDATPDATTVPDTPAFLAGHGIRVTRGAAAGYVADEVCASCHGELARSYRETVAMARSFYRPSRQTSVEQLGVPFEHAPSRQHFLMEWRGERLVFRRWQLDERGNRVHELEQEVDWVLGSGNHARTYLYQTPSGELWQLPINWYVEGGWGMAPGYDRADHEGVQRIVQRECMVCHDAFAELPAGEDRFGMPHRFPTELPEGIGCQRCHGPGAEHVRRARDSAADFTTVSSAIVNPSRLPRERRMDVCYQCHLQPSVALPSVRAFARGDLAFRPGEELAAHRVELEPVEEGRPREARFEINHHAFRLDQSPCVLESGGALTCLTCHDPHRKPPPAERVAFHRGVCQGCHRDGGAAPPPVALAKHVARESDCASCHMPRRRPTDVVRVTMTDHRIQVPPTGVDLAAPLAERDPVLVDVRFHAAAEAPARDEGELYRAVGVLRIGGRDEAVPYLERLLARSPSAPPEPWLRLAEGQLLLRRYADAEATFRRMLPLVPELPLVRTGLAIAAAGQGKREEALAHLREGLAVDPEVVETRFDLGRLLLAAGRAREAAVELERTVALRPNLVAGWLRLGQAREALGGRTAAIADYRRALALEPSTTDAHVALVLALRAAGDEAAAEAAERLALRYARRPEAVRAALAAGSQPPR